MATPFKPLAPLVLKASRGFVANATRPGRRRRFASVAYPEKEGPLAGIRVLDMTRVLAGVREVLPKRDRS